MMLFALARIWLASTCRALALDSVLKHDAEYSVLKHDAHQHDPSCSSTHRIYVT